MTLLHERHDSLIDVELFVDEHTKRCEVWVTSVEHGVFGIDCGTDGKKAVQAFHHPFAYRATTPNIDFDVSRAIGAYSD
jgi:hypothetical protein